MRRDNPPARWRRGVGPRANGKHVFDSVEAGSHNFVWDGTAEDGSRAADGIYTLSLSATLGSEAVSGRSLQFGPVTSIVRGANGTDLQVGDLGVFKVNDVKQIL